VQGSGASCNSSSRFGAISTFNWVAPVTLPPGRLRLATRPSCTGSPLVVKTIGIVVVAALAATAAGVLVAAITVNQIACQDRQSLIFPRRPPEFYNHVAAFDVASFAKPLAKSGQRRSIALRRSSVHEPDHRHRRLCERRDRPSRRCTAEKYDEIASSHIVISRRISPGGQERIPHCAELILS
jgi:hypothetical protein